MMIVEYFICIVVAVIVAEFSVKRLLDVYLYVKERLNEENKH